MKRKMVVAAIISTMMAGGLLGVSAASAHGLWGWGAPTLSADEIASRQETMFEQQAKILGLTVDQVKVAWSQGKTMQEIIKDNNLNTTDIQNRLNDQRTQQMKDQMQTLVTKGIITQAQADARIKVMQSKAANGKMVGHGIGRGLGHMGF